MKPDAESYEFGSKTDYLSIFFVILTISFVAWYLVVPEDFPVGRHSIPQTLALLSFVPCGFGMIWLIFRHAASVMRRYPILSKRWFQLIFIFFIPILMFVVIPLVRFLVWIVEF